MSISNVATQKIQFLIERFFISTVLAILIVTLGVCFYVNQYLVHETQKDNLQKIHILLSQLITPSLLISDFMEVKHLLYMASGSDETFLILDNDNIVIMPDYEKQVFSNYVLNLDEIRNTCYKTKIQQINLDNKKYLVNCSTLKSNDLTHKNKKMGFLISFTSYNFFSIAPIFYYFIGAIVSFLLILIFVFRRMLYRHLLRPLFTLKDRMLDISINFSIDSGKIEDINNAPQELIDIKESFERLLLSLHEEYGRSTEAEKLKALIDLAADVAHDIRSPLIALDIIINDIKNIDEEQRIIIRNSTNRINDIANNLLTQYRDISKINTSTTIAPQLVSDILVQLISEKRVQYKNTQLRLDIEESSYGKFSLISSTCFNRVLSNIINNSIEAFSKLIVVTLSSTNSDSNNSLVISVADNGCGISQNTLLKISNNEKVSSKTQGHGLGLIYVRKTIKNEWNGQFHIESFPQKGTKVEIILPQTYIPSWFQSSLCVHSNESIVIVDDDESIHQIWKKRFKNLSLNFKFINLYDPQELQTWLDRRPFVKCIFLIDYEFIDSKTNGIDIIENLKISNKSFLVTSRHEDVNVRERCEQLGLRIIPKTFAIHIPLSFSVIPIKKIVDLVFIDDDINLLNAWALHATKKGKCISIYNSYEAFVENLDKYDFNTPIYIDSNLNAFQKGEDSAKDLFNKGFNNIHLSTGKENFNFPKMYWIKKIVGKEPPF